MKKDKGCIIQCIIYTPCICFNVIIETFVANNLKRINQDNVAYICRTIATWNAKNLHFLAFKIATNVGVGIHFRVLKSVYYKLNAIQVQVVNVQLYPYVFLHPFLHFCSFFWSLFWNINFESKLSTFFFVYRSVCLFMHFLPFFVRILKSNMQKRQGAGVYS